MNTHGIDCPKVPHVGEGYLHGSDHDGPYDVDGAVYCGRCHGWIGTGLERRISIATALAEAINEIEEWLAFAEARNLITHGFKLATQARIKRWRKLL